MKSELCSSLQYSIACMHFCCNFTNLLMYIFWSRRFENMIKNTFSYRKVENSAMTMGIKIVYWQRLLRRINRNILDASLSVVVCVYVCVFT